MEQPHLSQDNEYLKGIKEAIRVTKKIEDINFNILNEVLLSIGIHKNPYESVTLENINGEGLEDLVQESFDKLQLLNHADAQKIASKLYNYLSEEDKTEASDVIFVFGGGRSFAKADKAIELYKEGLAPVILFTGNRASYMKESERETEAERFANHAKKNGIPKHSIVEESKAINTVENAKFSMDLLNSLNIDRDKIIMISIPYHLKRSLYTLKATIKNDKTKIIRQSSESKFSPESYWNDINGWKYVFYEYIKLYGARTMGHF
jgi:uncharacterized SAM-binding protein YcdF (DUF218 family)